MSDYERILALRDRQLDFVRALDAARDALDEDGDPQAMFQALAELLCAHLQAEAAGILLLAETSEEIESLVYVGSSQQVAIDLCRQALPLSAPGRLVSPEWAHVLGAHIMLHDAPYPLGALFVARHTPFDDEALDLLRLAESQLDSAVIQARAIWKLAQRNRELEAIYQIDRMRDTMASETELIQRLTLLLLEQFRAELCLFFLSHIDQGDLMMRGVVDKRDLPPDALETIRDLAAQIVIPQVLPTPLIVAELTLLAAPFIVSGVRLGAVVIGRQQPFSLGDHRLLYAMMSQMDSAIVYTRIAMQLAQRNRELETIYRLDRVRDQDIEFDKMLQQVLSELCKAVVCEAGYIMLYKERSEESLELKAITDEGFLAAPENQNYIRHLSRRALERGEQIHEVNEDGAIRSIAAVPLILNERVIGVFGVINSPNARGFNAEDRRMLSAITSQVDTAIFERIERRRMRKLLTRSVDPKVLEHLLLNADEDLLAGERVSISVLFADIRGSTEWAERIPAEELVASINIFLGRMVDVIFKHAGTLDKFVGDEVIGLFGTPLPMKDHALIACRAALEMQAVHQQLQAEMAAQGRELPPIGIGISSGEAIAGEFGPPSRAEFTAMGRIVNLGARLCGAAKAGQVIISPTTHELLAGRARTVELEAISPKGISGPVQIYDLLEVDWKL
ncbi:MAG: GAF domain-containing protein [Chloroflexi bacterium]|nr:GAF domain-containing protein [Chloroflexota bacterium]